VSGEILDRIFVDGFCDRGRDHYITHEDFHGFVIGGDLFDDLSLIPAFLC